MSLQKLPHALWTCSTLVVEDTFSWGSQDIDGYHESLGGGWNSMKFTPHCSYNLKTRCRMCFGHVICFQVIPMYSFTKEALKHSTCTIIVAFIPVESVIKCCFKLYADESSRADIFRYCMGWANETMKFNEVLPDTAHTWNRKAAWRKVKRCQIICLRCPYEISDAAYCTCCCKIRVLDEW